MEKIDVSKEMSQIDNLFSQAIQNLQQIFKDAFIAGRNCERSDVLHQLGAFTETPSTKVPTPVSSPPTVVSKPNKLKWSKNGVTHSRNPAGTVKPVIEKLLLDNPKGITLEAIIQKTGFKKNSVSATLYTMQSWGLATYQNQLWFKTLV